ncbi:deoxyribonuclease IV [bacterium]|nr:MAG: deoxyribonuclease IV [bacterium]
MAKAPGVFSGGLCCLSNQSFNSPMPLGAHLPTSKGFAAALLNAQQLGLDCLQIFSKSPRQWNAAPLDAAKVADFRAKWEASNFTPLVAHDSYLINLAATNPEVREKSIAAMIDEVERADALGCDYLVTHCGAHLKSGEEVGMKMLAASLVEVLEKTPDLKVKIALENTAGQGTTLGGPFHHIGTVLKSVGSPRLSVCFDTCHAHAAGHDIVTDLESVLADFEANIGLHNLGVVHLNDSKGKLGGHLDRHEHIGEGGIGREGMRAILNHPKLKHLPFILETPEVDTKIADNIVMVRELQGA